MDFSVYEKYIKGHILQKIAVYYMDRDKFPSRGRMTLSLYFIGVL